jgi:hypothetical protein
VSGAIAGGGPVLKQASAGDPSPLRGSPGLQNLARNLAPNDRRGHSDPLVDGTLVTLGSMVTASRRATANALNAASMM